MKLDFIRPGRPVENGYIEIFNGRLRDECLNGEIFFGLADAREKIEVWRHDYNERRLSRAQDKTRPAWQAITPGAPGSGAVRAIALQASSNTGANANARPRHR